MKRAGLWGVVGVLGLAATGGFVSYLWLPHGQLDAPRSLWGAICASLGVPQPRSVGLIIPQKTRSDVVLTHDLLQRPQPGDIGHGATLALRCTPCHGPTGISYANSPNLAGQRPVAIYKQLHDYKFGARTNAIMTPEAQALSDTDMRQIAAYYASIARPRELRVTAEPPPIVRWGDPMRNVAPCGSCHGEMGHTLGSPELGGEPRAYLLQQLGLFAADTRTNDINGQMRAVARGMTSDEIMTAAEYYSGPSTPQ